MRFAVWNNIPVIPLTSYVTMYNYLTSWSLSFFNYKIGIAISHKDNEEVK